MSQDSGWSQKDPNRDGMSGIEHPSSTPTVGKRRVPRMITRELLVDPEQRNSLSALHPDIRDESYLVMMKRSVRGHSDDSEDKKLDPDKWPPSGPFAQVMAHNQPQAGESTDRRFSNIETAKTTKGVEGLERRGSKPSVRINTRPSELVETFENLPMGMHGVRSSMAIRDTLMSTRSAETLEKISQRSFTGTQDPRRSTKAVEQLTTVGYDWEKNHRLPDDVIPVHYNVFIDPHIGTGMFYGRVGIIIEVKTPRSQLWLHLKSLQVTATQLYDSDGVVVPLLGAHKFRKNEFWVMFLEREFRVGSYFLNIDYNGVLGKQVGLVVSKFNIGNHISKLIHTQLEPTYARRVFPCFDEPSMRATFSIQITCFEGYKVLSNSTVESEQPNTPKYGTTTFTFKKTPAIATHSVSVVITELEQIVSTDVLFPLSFYCRSGVNFEAMQKAKELWRALQWFSEYFQRPIPVSKIDVVAIPRLQSGTTAGWGMFLVKESLILGEEADSGDLRFTMAQLACSVWIGAQVSNSWWDDIWMKEGLANFLANLHCDQVYPDAQAIPVFQLSQMSSLYGDALTSSRPLCQEVDYPDEMAEAFDSISYIKASALFRMVHQADPSSFRLGLSKFIDQNEYRSAPWEQLVEALDNSSEMDLKRLFQTWLHQSGHPVILAARGVKALGMAQMRCLSNMKSLCDSSNSQFGYKWDLPISFVTSKAPHTPQVAFIRVEDQDVRVTIPDGVEWFKVNYRQCGFYRVTYHQEEWVKLKNVLVRTPDLLTAEDRANLIDDAFSLSRCGYLCYGVPLSLISYLRHGKETSWLPWAVAHGHLTYIRNALHFMPRDLSNFYTYVHYIIEPVLNNDLWDVKSPDDKYKITVLTIACAMEVPSAVRNAQSLFGKTLTSKHKPRSTAALRRIVYKYGMGPESSLQTNWHALWTMYLGRSDNDNAIILESLASTTNESLLKKLLTSMHELPDDQDFFLALFEMVKTDVGANLVWEFYKEEWDALTEKYSPSDTLLLLLIPRMSLLFHDSTKMREISEFGKNCPSTHIETALNNIRHNISWREKCKKTVSSWLNEVITKIPKSFKREKT